MGVCVDMKKMILSVIAILLIAGVLYVAIETPAATPVLVVLGPIAGFAVIGLAIYIRVGDMAERIRNMKTVARQRREAAKAVQMVESHSPANAPDDDQRATRESP